MIRANKRRRRGRRNPIVAAERKGRSSKKRGGRKSAKRSAAARKAARTRKRNKAKRRAAARKGARKAAGTRAYKRANKQNQTGWSKGDDPNAFGERRRSRRRRRRSNPIARTPVASRRRRRRRNPIAAAPAARRRRRRRNPIAAAPAARRRRRRRNPIASRRRRRRNPIASRRRRRARRNPIASRRRRRARRNPIASRPHKRHSYRGRRGAKKRKYHHVKGYSYSRGGKRVHVRRHMRNPLVHGNPIANPITGPVEFASGFLGVGFGFALASIGDRLAVTHALTGSSDAPAQGQVYNSEALQTPFWAQFTTVGYKRAIAAALSTLVPLGAASVFKSHLGWKTFFQLMGAGAFARTAGKVVDDGVAALLTTNPLAQRLYAGEIAATAKMNASSAAALPPAPPATFAGAPKGFRQPAPAPRTVSGPPPLPQQYQSPALRPQVTPIPNGRPEMGLPGLAGMPSQYGLPFNPALVNPDNNE